MARRHTRSSDYERHMDIFLVGCLLSHVQPMLTKMKPIIGSKNNKSVMKLIRLTQSPDQFVDQIIHRL